MTRTIKQLKEQTAKARKVSDKKATYARGTSLHERVNAGKLKRAKKGAGARGAAMLAAIRGIEGT